MSPSLNDLTLIRRQTLEALQALNRTVWRQASGEFHIHCKEMPNWITLDPGDDVPIVHRALCGDFESYFARMKEVHLTVSYSGGRVQVDFLDTNAAVRSALDDPIFGRSLREGPVG